MNKNNINHFISQRNNSLSQLHSVSESPTNKDNKYNPDVLKKFKERLNITNTKPDFINSYYKGITNAPLNPNIKSVNDLKLEMDKPDIHKLESNYEKSLKERTEEHNIINKSIINYAATHQKKNIESSQKKEKSNYIENSYPSINNVLIDNVLIDNQHLLLKTQSIQYNLRETDKLINEKKRFNKLLEDLEDLDKLI